MVDFIKAKTLYIVTAFIGKKGYKKETPQLINANSLDVTSEIGSADVSIDIISDSTAKSQEKLSDRDPDSTSPRNLLANALEGTVSNDVERNEAC